MEEEEETEEERGLKGTEEAAATGRQGRGQKSHG